MESNSTGEKVRVFPTFALACNLHLKAPPYFDTFIECRSAVIPIVKFLKKSEAKYKVKQQKQIQSFINIYNFNITGKKKNGGANFGPKNPPSSVVNSLKFVGGSYLMSCSLLRNFSPK